jgi:uncharacterized protein involved in exopolysaccharide biosynthesis
MKAANDPSGSEFGVRGQVAGTDPAQPPPRAAAKPEAGPNAPPAPQLPLRRPVTPENLMQFIDWPQLAHGVWRRAWMLALLTALGVSLGLYGRVRLGKPRYEARASILYRADRQKQTLSAPGAGVEIKGLARPTAVSLLRRAGNLEAVIARLKLDMTPEELGWRVQTQAERNSEIILLRADFMPTAELAVAAANEVVRVGLEDNRLLYRKQALQLAEQFKLQSAAAAAEAAAAREALIAFQTRHQLLEVGADTKAFLDSMGAVSERLHTARMARESQAVRIANYRRLIAELPDEVLRESFEDNPLKRRIANSEIALMEARTRYGPENPRVLQMEDSIREMRRTIAEQSFDESRERVYVRNPAKQEFEMDVLRIEAEQEVLDRSVEQIEQQAADLRETYKHLPAQQLELASLHQRQTSAETLVHDLERSIADAGRTAEIDLGDFEMLEPARTATESRGKLAALLPVLAVAFSLFAGMGLCVVLALMDPKLNAAGQIERLYSLPCLGTVPAQKDAAAVPAAFLPVCRTLYRRVTALPASEGARVFCVLSACPGDGKSTLAFQASRYWTAFGIRTACLDFDPEPNPWLRPAETQAGIEDYLAGRAAWEDILFMQDDVACFKRNRDTGDLPERMHGKLMRRFMETLRSQYGCVIVEAPAWLTEEPSARMLAEMTALSVWVAASPRSTRPLLNKAFDRLDRTGIRPAGIILNQVPGATGHGKKDFSAS